jgi:hypothetical protein
VYCAVWGLGGLLDVKDRATFDAELRSFGSHMPPRWGRPLGHSQALVGCKEPLLSL